MLSHRLTTIAPVGIGAAVMGLGAVATAGTAAASSADDAFIAQMKVLGVTFTSPQEAVREGRQVCTELAAGNAAIRPAAVAYRDALQLAVEVAVVETARESIGAELQATQRRLRGIERHRVRPLQDALRTLDLQLEELEREERVVARWARTKAAT